MRMSSRNILVREPLFAPHVVEIDSQVHGFSFDWE